MDKSPSRVAKLGLNNNESRPRKQECQAAMEQNTNLEPSLLILEVLTWFFCPYN